MQPIFYPIFSLICEEKNLVNKERKHPTLSIFPLKILPTKHSKKINFSHFSLPIFYSLKITRTKWTFNRKMIIVGMKGPYIGIGQWAMSKDIV